MLLNLASRKPVSHLSHHAPSSTRKYTMTVARKDLAILFRIAARKIVRK